MIREDVVERLVETGKWSDSTARVAERANYRCEYCSLAFLDKPEYYKLFEIDHIVPICAGGSQAFENLAIACRPCNFGWKRDWNPRSVSPHADRDELIKTAKEYINKQKARTQAELEEICRIVDYRGSIVTAA